MKNIVKNCFFEAKWCHQNYIPTMDEYMTVALVTSAYPMLSTTSFVGMGDIVTKESFEWLFSNPRFIRASSVVCRLMDDMASHEVNIYDNIASVTNGVIFNFLFNQNVLYLCVLYLHIV